MHSKFWLSDNLFLRQFLIFFFLFSSLYAKQIELFIYWQPELKGKESLRSVWLAGEIREKLLEKQWDICCWENEIYRPWLLSWKEVKNWQELKWRLGWDLPTGSPFQEETRFWVFWSLGPYIKHHDFSRISKDRLVLFLWEPPTVEPEGYSPELLKYFGKVFTWDDDLVDHQKFFKFYYPVLRPRIQNLPSFEEKKFCALFATRLNSRHPKQLYSERENVIRFFEDKPGEFALYGRNWEKRKYKNWRGRVENKLEVLKNYKFCICYENMRDVKGYITEKIFDSFAAGCVPVYWGASNITDTIPDTCFIDRRKFSSEQELYDFLKKITKEEYERYLASAEVFLKSSTAQLYSNEQFVKTFMQLTDEPEIITISSQ